MTRFRILRILLCAGSALSIAATPAVPYDVPHDAWMAHLEPLLGGLTLLDISLPGTHDTLTYDLSNTVADNANNMPGWASWLLHTFHKADGFVGDFIKSNAETQNINVTAQLQAGARFLDVRATFTSPPDRALGQKDWYSLHMVESRQKVMSYINQTIAFLASHPREIVVIFLSRHGCQSCTGDQQYPGASNAEKQALWRQIKDSFAASRVGLVPATAPLNETTISQLISKNQRAVIYAGDWANFTARDPLAWDALAHLYNGGAGENVEDLPSSFVRWDQFYRNNRAQRAQLKSKNIFFLMSLAGSPPLAVVKYAAEIAASRAVGLEPTTLLKECAAVINIPNLSEYCPRTLGEWERLRNFYSQVFLDRVARQEYRDAYSPPGAIYLDLLGFNGEIRTDAPDSDLHGFAYVDTLLLWNVREACAVLHEDEIVRNNACKTLESQLLRQRASYPMVRWNDFATGRHKDWPPP